MSNIENFNQLVERAIHDTGHAQIRPVIAKELLHYDILFCLDKNRLLEQLTFQGGTALRLCYGAPRLSEDLDFAGGKNFVTADLMNIKDCLEDYIGARYGLEIAIKEPKEMTAIPQNQDIKVDKWQISITVQQRTLQKNNFLDYLIAADMALLQQVKEIIAS